MQNQQEGIVLELQGKMAKVKTARHNDCDSCGSCPGNSAMIMDARNPLGATVGQRVMIEIQEVNMLKAAFIVYVLPLIAIFTGALAGYYFYWQTGFLTERFDQVAGGIVAFLLSVWYIKHYDYSARMNDKMQPVIIRIL